jgi:ankyrin repeat protein
LLVVPLLSISGCSMPQVVRDAGGSLLDDRLVLAPDVQAFFTAARRGDAVGLRAGLANGLDVNLAEPLYGRTALMRAAAFDHVAAAEAILAAGGNARAKDFEGDTVLHIAAASGAVNVIPTFL